MKAYNYILIISLLTCNILFAKVADKTHIFKVLPGGTLNLQVSLGEIKITTWDKHEVQVTVKGLYDDESNNLEITEDQKGVKIIFNGGWSDPDELMFIINAPERYNYDVNTNAGDITISGTVKGVLKANTQGGDIKTGSVDGLTELNTMGGDIASGNINGDVELSTAGGDITIGNVSGYADINTMGGDITAGDLSKQVKMKTQGGDIKIGSAGTDSELFTFGGDIIVKYITGNSKLNTHGGDIKVDGAKGNVNAKTLGGDLRMLDINGSIDASTASGDILVELNPDNRKSSKLITQDGSITLRIPEKAKAEITAIARVTGSHNDEDEDVDDGILSDFKAKTHDQNSQQIKDVYFLNGGGAKIQMESTNSGIKIRKLTK